MHDLTGWAGLLLAGVAASDALLTALAALATAARGAPGSKPRRAGTARPPVTLLKPLCGDEFALQQRLASFCDQDYPNFQLIFGLQDPHDGALPVVQRLRQQFPSLDIDCVIDSTRHGVNAKVSNLINMLRHARHPQLVIADSDIIVPRDYLTRVLSPLSDPQVGLVTCPYVGRPRGGLWSALGAMFISDWFMANVRLAQLFGAQSFVSGATIALRREVLDRFGRLSAVADELADDFKLGEQVRRLGLRIVVSDLCVETLVDEPTLSTFARHTLRWLRTIQSLQPWGYAFCFITFSVPLALLGAVLTRFSHSGVLLLEITLLARLVLHCFAARTGRPRLRQAACQLALLPLHDLLLPTLWCLSFGRRAISWRQQQFEIGRDGALYRLPEVE